MTLYNIHTSFEQIKKHLKEVNQYGTQYFRLILNEDTDDEVDVQIRVSNHSGRVMNNNGNRTLSFITSWNRQDCNMQNEWVVNDDGTMSEEFMDIEELLEWELN